MIEFLAKVDDKTYDITELITKISFKDSLNDGCSKLEFSYLSRDFALNNGSVVCFQYDSAKIFYGYVFKISRNKGDEISVTAYDQLRYCKAKDTIIVQNDTVTTLTRRMCNYLHLKTGIITDSKYVLKTSSQDDKTWLDIIYSGISDTLTNKGKWYSLRDEFHSICLRNLEDLQLNLVLGDKSLAYDFSYEKSIDEDYYNLIKILVKGETSKDSQFVVQKDNSAVTRYGLLQYYEKMENSNVAKAKSKAEQLLKLYNREKETLSLSCLGDTSVRAGSSFYGSIEDIKLKKRLIVKSVTHNFLPVYTMDVEAMI